VAIGSDGTFRADNLVFGSYTLVGYDGRPRSCAVNDPIVLRIAKSSGPDEHEVVGLGTVSGRVLNPMGERKRPRRSVRSLNPSSVASARRQRRNAGGFYSAATSRLALHVQRRQSCVAAARRSHGKRSSRTARRRDRHPAAEQPDQSAVTKWDANNFTFDLQPDGSCSMAAAMCSGCVCRQDLGGRQLDVIMEAYRPLTGATIATVEEKTARLRSQDDVSGVSGDPQGVGRLMVILRDTGDRHESSSCHHHGTARHEPHQGNAGGSARPAVIATSSGDSQLDVSDPAARDRWVVIDDVLPGDPFMSRAAGHFVCV